MKWFDSLISRVIWFLMSWKDKRDAKASLAEAEREGTISHDDLKRDIGLGGKEIRGRVYIKNIHRTGCCVGGPSRSGLYAIDIDGIEAAVYLQRHEFVALKHEPEINEPGGLYDEFDSDIEDYDDIDDFDIVEVIKTQNRRIRELEKVNEDAEVALRNKEWCKIIDRIEALEKHVSELLTKCQDRQNGVTVDDILVECKRLRSANESDASENMVCFGKFRLAERLIEFIERGKKG